MTVYETPNEPTGLVYGPLSDTPNFKVGQTVDIDQVHLVKKGVR